MQTGFFEKQIVLTPDLCGSAAALSPLAAFTIFQGVASEHAEKIGVGGAAMAKRGEFWLTVHSRVDFYGPAYLMDELTARTWPERCEGRDIRCFRSYRLTHGEKTVALGRTQWAILGPEGKILRFEQSGFPVDFPFRPGAAIDEPPTRFHDDLTRDDMLLMLDYGTYYEFRSGEQIVPLEGVRVGEVYAMIVTSINGLWRYEIGDTVEFTSTNPYRIRFAGRTRQFINAFGEELMVDNADKAIAMTCLRTGAKVKEYTAAPLFMLDKAKGRHQWFIEFDKKPESLDEFATLLDQNLQKLNSDYEAKRYKEISLQPLEIRVAREGTFYEWLRRKGKLGGQHKIPRLSNDRTFIEELGKICDL